MTKSNTVDTNDILPEGKAERVLERVPRRVEIEHMGVAGGHFLVHLNVPQV